MASKEGLGNMALLYLDKNNGVPPAVILKDVRRSSEVGVVRVRRYFRRLAN